MITLPYAQAHLGDVLHQLFPNYTIYENSRKLSRGDSPAQTKGHFLELDYHVPALFLGFEAQDPGHYAATFYTYEPLELVQQHDVLKRQQFLQEGGTLVIVPYWWDGSPSSLVATIREQRPDILPNFDSSGPSLGPPDTAGPNFVASLRGEIGSSGSPTDECAPVPLLPPPANVERFTTVNIPGIGGLMLATFDLQTVFTQFQWWLSEKYDGIRACWNKDSLYTKYGSIFNLPTFLKFPPEILDGEIWFGRVTAHEANQMMTQGVTKPWVFLRFLVFDYPNSQIGLPFEERYEHLLSTIPLDHPFVQTIGYRKCMNQEDLRVAMDGIMEESGEGVVLRQPASPYVQNRTETFLKYKALRDSEAVVTRDLEEGHFELKLASGQTLSSQLSSKYEGPSPQIGDVVSFSFLKIDQFGLPSSAQIYRIRQDMGWENVVDSFRSEGPRPLTLNPSTKRKLRPLNTRHPRGYWTVNGSQNIRNLLLDFAKSNNFDPNSAEAWYKAYPDISFMKEARVVLDHYNGSKSQMLVDIFPHISFDLERFPRVGMNYWENFDNKRRLLEKIAKENGFDPLIAESWYKYRSVDIIAMLHKYKGGSSVLRRYGGSPTKILMEVFPEINLDLSKFRTRIHGYWFNKDNVRKFLDQLAEQQGFNPLIPENWYKITAHDIFSKKSGSLVFELYGSLKGLIASNYPNLKFDLSKFAQRKEITYNMEKQRRFFFDFAAKNNFDPLVPTNWYSRKHDILQLGDGFAILEQNRWSLRKALICNLPEVNFDFSLFANPEAKALLKKLTTKTNAEKKARQVELKMQKELTRKRKRRRPKNRKKQKKEKPWIGSAVHYVL